MSNFEKEMDKDKKDFEHPMDIEEFRKRGYEMIDFICDYKKNIEKQPVISQVEPGYLKKLIPEFAPKGINNNIIFKKMVRIMII
jgi:hypothetical protein